MGISHNPGMLKCVIGVPPFTIKDEKIEEPESYLGEDMTKMVNCEEIECWAMSTYSYCAVAVANVEKVLNDKEFRLPFKCNTPMVTAPSWMQQMNSK